MIKDDKIILTEEKLLWVEDIMMMNGVCYAGGLKMINMHNLIRFIVESKND